MEAFKELLEQRRFEQGIQLVRGGAGSPLSEFTKLLGSQQFVSRFYPDPGSFAADDLHDIPIDAAKKHICVNCVARFDSSVNPVERVIIQAYEVLKMRRDVKPILCMDEYSFQMIPDWCDTNGIPGFLFKDFELGSLDDEAFLVWFRDQFPSHVDDGVLEIMMGGTGRDFDRALLIRNAFFEREETRLFFLTPANETTQVAHFQSSKKGTFLMTGKGISLHIPVKFFIFDTSALLSSQLTKFVTHIGEGSYIIPPFILDEVHRVEERLKREGNSKKVSRLKNNLNNLSKNLDQRNFANKRQRVDPRKVDNQLIRAAMETSAIVVAADNMIVEHCQKLQLPVIVVSSE